jgi:APA family basic amino acid/polyamine antiporter
MRLKRDLGFPSVFCIASGAMISSGLFVLPGAAFAKAGPAMFLSYLLAGILAVPGMLCQAELVSAMPRAGGDYFYVTRSLGPAVGTVDGIIIWFSLIFKTAFALIGIAAFTELLVDLPPFFYAAVFGVLFTFLNLLGTRHSGKTQIYLVVILFLLLIGYAVGGFSAIKPTQLEPFAPHGKISILYTAGFVFVCYGGLLKVTSVAEEVRDPGRTIPRAMIASLIIVTTLYVLTVLVTAGVVPDGQLRMSQRPITEGAVCIWGPWGAALLSMAAILAFISTANAGIMAAGRYPLALCRDGVLPEFVGRLHPRFGTPYISITITGLMVIAVCLLEFTVLVKAASSVLIMSFAFACVSVIILRESRLQNYQPGFKLVFYPIMPILGLLGYAVLLYQMRQVAVWVILAGVLGGFAFYWFSSRIREMREFALLHLIERITAKELTDWKLETELRDIVRARENIEEDRFDRVVKDCLILDIPEAIDFDGMTDLASEKLKDHIDLDKDEIKRLLQEREAESSTVISDGVAVPHIILEEPNRFALLLCRCEPGIQFNDSAKRVRAVFMLLGSRGERNFHLRALAAIAQIVQDPDFEKKWLRAKGEFGLRDLLLTSGRNRG